MAYTDDWENLMNGVFGPGGKLRFDTQKTQPEKPGLPDMNAALLEQQKKLDEMLKKQNAELRRDTTQEALAQSRKMLEDMEADGLLAKGTTEVRQEHLGSFEGLAAEVKKTVLGQDAFAPPSWTASCGRCAGLSCWGRRPPRPGTLSCSAVRPARGGISL